MQRTDRARGRQESGNSADTIRRVPIVRWVGDRTLVDGEAYSFTAAGARTAFRARVQRVVHGEPLPAVVLTATD
jgi:hypothetical protein